ncbi:MAG: UbiX family flavin prenyltransferase [Rectinemataceae bacterium]|nr:UbiX family flavin prenyltransferase [Spirochaetaceae bacterium]
MAMRVLVCITGASGALYPLRLIAALTARGVALHVIATPWGGRVILEETARPLGYWLNRLRYHGGPGGSAALVTLHASDDFSSPLASGSFRLSGTVVAPCSMGTMGALASGTCTTLVHRAGAVALKEGWPLILVPREAPLSLIALRSMTTLKEAGAVIMPASPSFYSRPATIEALVDTVVHRVLDHLGLEAPTTSRWS